LLKLTFTQRLRELLEPTVWENPLKRADPWAGARRRVAGRREKEDDRSGNAMGVTRAEWE
jgi:hypothetical protein